MINMTYDFKKTLLKVARRIAQFGLPLLLGYLTNFHPEILSLTVGGVLEIAIDWARHKNLE